MLQVRKSCSCGISDIFFQCCFMIETSINDSFRFSKFFFSRNHFLEEGFTFQWRGGLFFRWGRGFIFKWVGSPWGGDWFWWGGWKKNCRMEGAYPHAPHYGKPCIFAISFYGRLIKFYLLCPSFSKNFKVRTKRFILDFLFAKA